MEKLTIQDASRRLNISQRDIREYIRSGELKAERDAGSENGRWLVEMPEDGWQDKFKTYLDDLDKSITRWWWSNERKTGSVHYLANTGIENVEPDYLCGRRSENLWSSVGHIEADRCLECLMKATEQGLPLFEEDLKQGE
ncbi:MAG: helix-turn-helix domain-containing protein [Chloroflexi bacterium]|nr:helix-turn-helix domain-containing protein [Chloroflexota bacterium]MCI0901492.1 helix-turn-helix domain-containing protein [Chloroflexota bacterium]